MKQGIRPAPACAGWRLQHAQILGLRLCLFGHRKSPGARAEAPDC